MEGKMKKKLIAIILIMMLILASCTKPQTEDTSLQNSNDKIQIMYYSYKDENNFTAAYLENLKKYCLDNSIPLEISKFDEDTVSKEEYLEKRNAAAETGNLILLDKIQDIHDISNQHADYTKLENYDNLFSAYKDRFCIPISIFTSANYIGHDLMNHYSIDIPDKSVITYTEYLEIKQDIKKKGAKFEYNSREYNEMLEYHLNSSGLLMVNGETEIINNEDSFKKSLKQSIYDICNDIILYSASDLNPNIRARDKDDINEYFELSKFEKLYDNNSGLTLAASIKSVSGITFVANIFRIDLPNNTFFFNPYFIDSLPNFFMHEKVTNAKIYDVANYMLGDAGYSDLYEMLDNRSMPTFSTVKIKELINATDDWQLKDTFNATDERRAVINCAYELLFKNEEKSKEVADYLYYNERYSSAIRVFVDEAVFEIAKKLSGESLSLASFDPKNQEINKLVDDKIDEFITNFR
jgi:hypothetical protein